MTNHPTDCTCLRLADRMRAELAGAEVLPCPTHEPAAHQARETEQARAAARAEADQLAETLGVTVRDEEPPADPLAEALARKLPPNVTPLNAPPAAYEALRPFLSTDPNNDGPEAA